jgi:hypothetical protein
MTKKTVKPSKIENLLISKFLLSLNEKNYSKTNKYLKKIIESKLNKRVKKTINNF